MKKIITILLALVLALGLMLPVCAEGSDYVFTALANGKSTAVVKPGETVTVTLTVSAAAAESFDLNSMQDYLCFNTDYLRYVEGSLCAYPRANESGTTQILDANPIKFSVHGTDYYNRVYLSRTSNNTVNVENGSVMVKFDLLAMKKGMVDITHDKPELFSDPSIQSSIETVDATVMITEREDKTLPFVDVVEGDWCYDGVCGVYFGGIMSGFTPTRFEPNSLTNRAQIATVMYNIADRPSYSVKCSFIDVPDGYWAEDAISWATETGVMVGYDENYFGPQDNITREQLAAVLWRYDGQKSAFVEINFTDLQNFHQYSVPAVKWCLENGIVSGYNDGSFRPQNNATRAHIAVMMSKFLKL